jgi:hypothetical protein
VRQKREGRGELKNLGQDEQDLQDELPGNKKLTDV